LRAPRAVGGGGDGGDGGEVCGRAVVAALLLSRGGSAGAVGAPALSLSLSAAPSEGNVSAASAGGDGGGGGVGYTSCSGSGVGAAGGRNTVGRRVGKEVGTARQPVAPAALVLPGAHVMQKRVPEECWNWPAGQAVQPPRYVIR
jgi:hypothetical protein